MAEYGTVKVLLPRSKKALEFNSDGTYDKKGWSEIAKESAKKLLALADEKDAMMIYGHDSDQWRTLRKAPSGFYS